MNQLAFVAFLFLLISWLLPDSYRPWLSAYNEFAVFFGGLVLCLALLCVRSVSIRAPYTFLFLFVVIVTLLAQCLAGVIYLAGDAIINGVYVLGLISMLVVGYNLSQAPELRPVLLFWLAVTLLLSATASTWLALYQWTSQPGSIWVAGIPPKGRPFANLGQPNQLATLLSMGLAAVLFFYEKRLLHRISSGLLALLLLFGIALTQSRTPWLMAVFFVVLWLWKYNAKDRRLSRPWAITWVLVFVGIILTLPALADLLQLSSVASAAERAKSLSRWPMYTQFLQAVLDGPIWGYGWQQGNSAQLAVAPLYSRLEYTEYTHNILLDLLIWNGPLLGSIIIIAVSYYLLRMAFLARSTENLFVVMAVGFFLLHSLLEYPHAYAYFLLPVGLLIGILQADFPCQTLRIPRWSVAVFLIGSIGLYAMIWQEYRIIEEDYRLMRFEKNRVGTLKADQPAPDVMLLTQLQALTKHSRLPATANMTADELYDLSRFAKRFAHPAALFKYAQALAFNGQPDAAYQQLMLIKNVHGENMLLSAIHELDTLKEQHPGIEPLLERLHKEQE